MGEARAELSGEFGSLTVQVGDAPFQFGGSLGHDSHRHLTRLHRPRLLGARHKQGDVIGVQSRGQQFPDPGDRGHRRRGVAAVPVAVTVRMQQTLLLVVAQHPGGDPGALRQFTDQHVITGIFGLTFTPM